MLLLIDPLTPLYWTKPEQMLGEYRQHYDAVQAGTENYALYGDENGYYATSYFNPRLAGANPFSQRDRSFAKNDGVNVNGAAYMNLQPVKWVTFTSRLGYRLWFNNSSDWDTPYYLNGQSKNETYTISGASNNGIYYQWENFVNYNQSFGKHNVGAMVGMSFRQTDTNGVSANASGPDILTSYEPNYIYLSCVNGNSDTTKGISGMPGKTNSLSYFGRLMYNYDNRYAIQGNFRADAFDSSKLSKDNRWGKFASVSAGWTISNEKFFKDNISSDAWSFAKIRASYGTNGNVNVLGNYSYTAGIATNGQWYQYGNDKTPAYGSMPNGLANPNLTWETSEQIDLGLDLRFLNDRLSLSMDWYKKDTKDLLVDAPCMPESGVSSQVINAGKVRNTGFELELSWKDRIGDFKYGVSANLATLNNKVTYLDPSITRIKGNNFDGSNLITACYFEQDMPLWYMRGYKFAGVAQADKVDANNNTIWSKGDALYYTKNGDITSNPTDEDMGNIGSGIPDMTYGITLSAEYKGIDLTIFGAGAAGNDIAYGMHRVGYNNISKDIYDMAKSGEMPNPMSIASDVKYWSSSAMVFNGSYFKIKQIQLGYTLPKAVTRKAYIENLRLYVSLDDFFTFTKYPGLDPETASRGHNGIGLDSGAYPNMRKMVLGASITF